jgi:hypothetical protein
VHPDGSHPDEAEAKRINEAHTVAIDTLTGADLVPVKALTEIVRRNTAALERASLSEAVATTVSQVVTHHVGALAQARRQRAAIAALTALIGAVVALTRTVPNLSPSDQVSGVLTAAGGFMIVAGAMLGVFALLSKSREERLQLLIEEATDTLNDRGTLLATLHEVGIPETGWSRGELQSCVSRWLASDDKASIGPPEVGEPLVRVARRIGSVDFARLLLAKGQERGVVEEAELARGGSLTYGYRIIRSPR